MITYAQNFEDVMLARVFGARSDGFYVDVGAGDPVDMSVTKSFYDLGWSGINVEPNPLFYSRLVHERSRDINLNCGAGAAARDATYFQLAMNELSSFDPRIRARAEAAGMTIQTHTVTVLPLNEILDRHSKGRSIDFLKIDVEGWEREVLTGIDLQRYRPTIIIVEATTPTTRIASHLEWEGILEQARYFSVYFDGLSRFYLPAEGRDLTVHFQTPPGIFDDIKSWHQAAREDEVALLQNQIAALEGKNAELHSQIAALESKNAGLHNQIVALEGKNAGLQQMLEAFRCETDALCGTYFAAASGAVGEQSGVRSDPQSGSNSDVARILMVQMAVKTLRSRKALLRRAFDIHMNRLLSYRSR
jgi:FkbM family methyltransferase